MFHGPGPGRPKGSVNKASAEFKQLILDQTDGGKKLFAKLLEWLDGGSDTLKALAMTKLLEYSLGKPKEQVEHSVDENLESILTASFKPPTKAE